MVPEDAALTGSKLIITTEEEAKIIGKANIILESEINTYPLIFKARMLKKLLACSNTILIIGVDPGNIIGISVFYLDHELESTSCCSIENAIKILKSIIFNIESSRKIVRIGNGDMFTAMHIAKELKERFKNTITIEMVDEFGTSRSTASNRRWRRDEYSAKRIAFRSGTTF